MAFTFQGLGWCPNWSLFFQFVAWVSNSSFTSQTHYYHQDKSKAGFYFWTCLSNKPNLHVQWIRLFLEHDGVWPPRSTHTYSSLCVFTELPFPQGQLYSNALLTDMVNKHAHSPTAFDHTVLICVVLIQIRSVTQNQSTMCVHRHQLQWQNTKATIWMSFRIHSSSTIMGDEFQKSKVELTKTITTKASNSSKNVWIEKAGES